MNHIMLLGPGKAGVSEDVSMVHLEVESSEGPVELQYAADKARAWTAAFAAAEALVSRERLARDMTVQSAAIRKVDGLGLAVDYRGRTALVRARLSDGTSSELAFSREDMRLLADFFQRTEAEFAKDDALRNG